MRKIALAMVLTAIASSVGVDARTHSAGGSYIANLLVRMQKSVVPCLTALLIVGAAARSNASSLITYSDAANVLLTVADVTSEEAWATEWTQGSSSTNVTLTAPIFSLNSDPGAPSRWWITTSIGSDFNPSDVVYSGLYIPNQLYGLSNPSRLAVDDSILGTGLSFQPGHYFLVIGGPIAPKPPELGPYRPWGGGWLGTSEKAQLASGYSVGDLYQLYATGDGSDEPAWLVSDWTIRYEQIFHSPNPYQFTFRLTEGSVPEPASWAMMLGGFCLIGGALRHRRNQSVGFS